MTGTVIEIVRIVVVMALVSVAAVILTPRGRIPLALRGIYRIMKKDKAVAEAATVRTAPDSGAVSLPKRLLGFFLVILAFILAVIRL